MAAKEKKVKKKKSWFRRILKWTGYTILFLIAAIIIIPIVFKDEIKEMVLDEVNTMLKADVEIKDFDLTFLSTFPNVTIQLYDVSVTGRTEYKGVKLAEIKQIEAHVGLWDVIGGDQIEIDEVHITDATFDVRVSPDGKANYDIVIPTDQLPEDKQAEPSNFKLSLQEYSLSNINLVYDDQAGDMYAKIKNLNHTGSGDLTEKVVDFVTSTTMDELTYEMEGLSYLSKVKTKADATLLMEFGETNSKFTLKENNFELNNFHFGIDGFYEMLADHDQMDLKLNAKEITFKDLLSLVPSFYQSGYESMIAKGNVQMGGEVKGRMDDKNMPGWDFGLNVNKAKIQYQGLPGAISNITIKAGSKFAGGENLDKMTLDVDKFHADFVGNVIDARLKMRNPLTDPLLDSKLLAKINLATLGKVMPLAEGESYKGKLNADVVVNGRMSALEREDYEAFKALGTLELFDMLYKSKDLAEDVAISSMVFRFSPKNLALEKLNATMGKSDFAMTGTIDNYMGYIFRDELLKGDFTFNSNNLDLDQLMGASTSSAPAAASTSSAPAAATSSEEGEPFLIPENVDFNLNTSIKKIKYNGIDVNNVSGNVNMKEEVASLNNMTMQTMGGTVGLKGSYNTKDHNKPGIDFGYNLKDIDIQTLAKNFVSIDKLAPIAKYTKGKISSNLEMKSSLTKGLEPIYSSLTGGGDLFTNMVTVSGFEPLTKLGEELKISKLANQTIKDVKAKFKFTDGKVVLSPFNVMLSGIDTRVEGSTSFEQAIDYKMTMNIPKEMIPAGMIKLAEQGLSKVNGVVPKLNLGSIPDVIPVKALVGGTVLKPKITTDFKESLLKATGNLKDNLVDKGKELVDKAKDSIKGIVNDKVEEVKEDLNAKKQEILDKGQKEADKVKAEAKKLADQARQEGENACDAAYKEAGSNPIKKKAADVTCKQAKKTAENKAKKIEDEAQKKADGVMSDARERADKIK
ncbi:MAG: AsmA-like C-terminal region-containing protein [Fluviicola sp.]|nr:AsmA-like C-terminal region-containing protein [Fluviicola sp.]